MLVSNCTKWGLPKLDANLNWLLKDDTSVKQGMWPYEYPIKVTEFP